jgi:hypothetical protein
VHSHTWIYTPKPPLDHDCTTRPVRDVASAMPGDTPTARLKCTPAAQCPPTLTNGHAFLLMCILCRLGRRLLLAGCVALTGLDGMCMPPLQLPPVQPRRVCKGHMVHAPVAYSRPSCLPTTPVQLRRCSICANAAPSTWRQPVPPLLSHAGPRYRRLPEGLRQRGVYGWPSLALMAHV